ncbi:MAG: peroxiredoxin family protein [Nitrospinota bacterium]
MCQRQLVQLQGALKDFEKAGAKVVAISSDDALTVHRTSRELSISFPLLSDPERKLIRTYGVLHPREGIARPATFIVDKRGIVRYRYVGKNFADRPPVARVLRAVQWL